MAKPTPAQMKKIESVSHEGEDGTFYYLKRGWRREPCDLVHHVHEPMRDENYDASTDSAREQMKRVVPCDCDYCTGKED